MSAPAVAAIPAALAPVAAAEAALAAALAPRRAAPVAVLATAAAPAAAALRTASSCASGCVGARTALPPAALWGPLAILSSLDRCREALHHFASLADAPAPSIPPGAIVSVALFSGKLLRGLLWE